MVTRAVLVAFLLCTTAAAQSAPAPVLFVPLPGQGLSEDVARAVTEAVPQGIAPRLQRRELRTATDLVPALLACEDAACRGQRLAEAGGTAGVLVTVSRARATGPVLLRFEVVDAVSGAPRGDAVEVEVPAQAATDATALAAHLAPTFEALAPLLPTPPARATLLVASNVDGAQVQVDGEPRGETPLAPLELEPGTHTVTITARGYEPFNRSVELSLEGTRLNVDLTPAALTAEAMAQQDAADAEGFTAGAPATKPLHKQWWLWAAVGGAVVLVTTIAIIAAAASGGGGGRGFEIPPIPEGM